jgi:cystathionine beta-lyase/cystathionine gamma-synthase
MTRIHRRLETQLIHAGEPRPRILGAIAMPIFQSAMGESTGHDGYHDMPYIRLSNTPNHTALAAKLATLEGAQSALVTASGMAAISTTLLALLSAGDHVLAQSSLYGGTYDLLTGDFPRLGVSCGLIDADAPGSWEAALRPGTKVIYAEAMSNPLLQVGDLQAIARFAREHGLVSIIDSTFATPVNFRPIEIGFDLVIHSATKYLNGHSDIVGGVVAGSAQAIEQIRHKLNHLGGSMDPHAAFLLHRGLKTLALRVRWQNESALAIAKFLASHPRIIQVNYPGLPGHPQHARASELFSGFGGMLSFELDGGLAAAEALMAKVTLPAIAPSLGGVETLLTRPAATSHAGMSAEERESIGIRDGLIRMSVGLEATDDLMLDLEQALG